jgi:hypothetical protein
MWFLFLLLFICWFTFIDLDMFNHSCICRMKPTWSWCYIFWNLLNLACQSFVENFCFYVY